MTNAKTKANPRDTHITIYFEFPPLPSDISLEELDKYKQQLDNVKSVTLTIDKELKTAINQFTLPERRALRTAKHKSEYEQYAATEALMDDRMIEDESVVTSLQQLEDEQLDPDLVAALSYPQIRLYDLNEAGERLKNHTGSMDKDSRVRRETIYNIMYNRGTQRELGTVSNDYKVAIDRLRLDYPNFGEVIDHFEGAFALSMHNGRVVTAHPVLLNGEPGIGKTSFAKAIAKIYGTEFHVIPMATTETGTSLGGSSSHWSNSQTGKVFDHLVEGRYANPVILIDEIDKAAHRDSNNPIGALYTLLEKDTASKFVDQSIDVTLDASYIVWVLTSNSADPLPSPILDRLTVFNVPSPNEEQTESIVKSIYNSLLKSHGWGRVFPSSNHLDDSVVRKFRKLSPRSIKNNLIRAFGTAARNGREWLVADDVHSEVSTTRKIGF